MRHQAMRHQAIVNLYKNVVGINDSGAFDINEKLVAIDEQAVEAEVTRLQAELPNKLAKQNRAAAYATEADPLFFKAQRGEATEEEWLAKIEEIKTRYPYTE
jgi:hypothetical protein